MTENRFLEAPLIRQVDGELKNQVLCGKLLKGLTTFITLECSLRQEQMSYLINCMAKLH